MNYTKLIPAAVLAAPLTILASIDWDGDTSKTSAGLDTWIIAEAAYASTAPAIDGVKSAGEWDDAQSYPLNEVYHITEYEGEMDAAFSVKWDETYVYVLVEASDSVGMAGQGHKFELYFSTAYTRNFGAWQLPGYEEGDYQLSCVMNPEDTFYELGLYSDQDALPSFQRANSIDGTSYVSEVRIAWADLGGLPSQRGLVNADYIGFEVHTQRNAPPGGHNNRDRTKRGWAGITDTAWAATEDWGTLRLMADGGGGPVDPTWGGYPVVDGWVDTGSTLGMLYVEWSPWVYSEDLSIYVYMPEPAAMAEGMWLFKPQMP